MVVVVKIPSLVVSTHLSPCLKAAVRVLGLGRAGTWQNAHNKATVILVLGFKTCYYFYFFKYLYLI